MSTRTRLLRVQRGFYERLKAQLDKQGGPMPQRQRDYAERYRREFRSPQGLVPPSELIDEIHDADAVICGDYHTLGQAQKTVLRILRRVLLRLRSQNKKAVLALEMLRPSDDRHVQAYLENRISEREFLKSIEFVRRWGVGWDGYRRLMRTAHRMGMRVEGLSTETPKNLETRDRFAADRVVDLLVDPDTFVCVVFGDLHLANAHLPKVLRAKLLKKRLKRKITVVHQNADSLYWKLAAAGGLGQSSVVSRLGRGRYCVLNTPPWIKLHSYSHWLDKPHLTSHSQIHEAPQRSWIPQSGLDRDAVRLRLEAHSQSDGTHDEIDYTGELREILGAVGDFLGLSHKGSDQFTLAWPSDPSFLDRLEVSRGFEDSEVQTLLHRIGALDTSYIPRENLLFMGSLNFNRAVHEASVALLCSATGTTLPLGTLDERFYVTVWMQAFGFVGSKIYNPNRKCAGIVDIARMARGFRSGSFGQKICMGARVHLEAEWSSNFKSISLKRLELVAHQLGVNPAYFVFEVASVLGRLLGQGIYTSILRGDVASEDLGVLFRRVVDSREAMKLYFGWAEYLDSKSLRDFSHRDAF